MSKSLCPMLSLMGLVGIITVTSGCDEPVTPESEDPGDPTFVASQSETAIAVIPAPAGTYPPTPGPPKLEKVVVTYNDDTGNDGKIIYEPDLRTVLHGASQFGWSYSEDAGASWTYGGKVYPPPGWAVLWGDPAIVRSGSTLWISNLAVPDSKYPADGITGGLADFLGGACIAKSVDDGKHFSIHGCITNQGHFYDGGNMEATADGSVWATYWDVNTTSVALWRSYQSGPFDRILSSPFPDNPATAFVEGQVVSHPRVRAVRSSALTPVLYLAAQLREEDGTVGVWLNRYIKDCATCGFRWGTPFRAIKNTDYQPTIFLGPWSGPDGPQQRLLRTGPQFSFDVLQKPGPDQTAVAEIRAVATRQSSSGEHLVGVRCPGGGSCTEIAGWSTLADAPASQFNPVIRVNTQAPNVWKVSWLATDGPEGSNGNVVVWQGNLLLGAQPFPRNWAVAPHEVCSDRRGYWGDYDDLQVLREPSSGSSPTFVRAESDSDLGCVFRQEYNQQHLHVSAVQLQ